MSFYGPDFANISSGWYSATDSRNYAPVRKVIDTMWSQKWDSALRQYLKDYGTFYTAFLDDLQKRFEQENGLELNSLRYFSYYAMTRAWSIPDLRRIWARSEANSKQRTVTCTACGLQQPIGEIHPSVIRREWPEVHHCFRCSWINARWKACGHQDADLVLRKAIQTIRTIGVSCKVCGQTPQQPQDSTKNADFEEMGHWLYINSVVRVCLQCYRRIFADYSSGSQELHARRLKDFVYYLGRIPQQEFHPLIHRYRNAREMLVLLAHIRKLRDADGYKKEFGSFLAALVSAGVLKDGTRKLPIGTMALAEDGHVCLSLVEKSIDDFLTRNGIAHDKERLYPKCHLRVTYGEKPPRL